MRVGVIGYQQHKGIEWRWVARAIGREFDCRPDIQSAMSSLAEGADQVFAQCALQRCLRLFAIIPIEHYSSYFDSKALARFERLLSRAERIDLSLPGNSEAAFLEARRYMVEQVDLLFAIWDGKRAAGREGVADIVSYAQECHCPIIQIDPLAQTVLTLNGK